MYPRIELTNVIRQSASSGLTRILVDARGITDAVPISDSYDLATQLADQSQGRFIACRAGFYDPAVFEAGRDVTFIGKIDGYQNTRIGEYDYRLPKLSADVIYLWPEQRQVDVVPYPYGPWGPGPWGPYWGGYGRWGWW